MEKGKTYTENEMEEIEFLEEEIRFIFYRNYIPDSLVEKATKMINRWKKLTDWKESN